MIRKLTEGSLKKSHLQSAFKGAGIYPYPRAAASPPSKLAPADAVKTPSRSLSKSAKTPQYSRAARTPALRLQLQNQFSNLFQRSSPAKATSRPKPSGRVELAYYGEVLTSKEVEERLARKEDQMKQRRKQCSTTAAKKAKAPKNVTRKTGTAQTEREKDENKCQGCYNRYDEDNPERQKAWVGCELFVHMLALLSLRPRARGLPGLPDEDGPWICPTCS